MLNHVSIDSTQYKTLTNGCPTKALTTRHHCVVFTFISVDRNFFGEHSSIDIGQNDGSLEKFGFLFSDSIQKHDFAWFSNKDRYVSMES